MVRSSLLQGGQQYQIVSSEATLTIPESLAGKTDGERQHPWRQRRLSKCQYHTCKHLVGLSLDLGLNNDESPDSDSQNDNTCHQRHHAQCLYAHLL